MNVPCNIPLSTLKRLPLYLRLVENQIVLGDEWISSEFLARKLGLESIQIRKDLSSIGIAGSPRRGFPVEETFSRLTALLNSDNLADVFLVGAGPLGEAVFSDRSVALHGFKIVAVFDCDPARVGNRFGNPALCKEVLPVSKLANLVRRMSVSLAILAADHDWAQAGADELVSAGIAGVLDLSGLPAVFPPSVAVSRTDFGVELSVLSGQIGGARRAE